MKKKTFRKCRLFNGQNIIFFRKLDFEYKVYNIFSNNFSITSNNLSKRLKKLSFFQIYLKLLFIKLIIVMPYIIK